ncbi:MAG: PASTA domain-containing protein, partial [Ilumatobacteraceae bacterium]
PDVTGETEAEAREELTEFDVVVEVEELEPGDPVDGFVLEQSISPGQLAPAGTTIVLTVGQAADPPPATDPPATDPPETDPPETDPPETDPVETAAPETAAPETPPATEPSPPSS